MDVMGTKMCSHSNSHFKKGLVVMLDLKEYIRPCMVVCITYKGRK